MVATLRSDHGIDSILTRVVGVLSADRDYSDDITRLEKNAGTGLWRFPARVVQYIVNNAAPQKEAKLRWRQFQHERFRYLSENLSLDQKRSVAHWLQFQLEQELKGSPGAYQDGGLGDTTLSSVVEKWRQYA